jgi:hypothetical protein
MPNLTKMKNNYNYWKFPQKPFPYNIYWKVIAGNRRLDVLEDHDLVFDEYDLKIRKIDY